MIGYNLEEYEIWTDHGWVDFRGIVKKPVIKLYEIKTETGKSSATLDHYFFINNKKVKLKNLSMGDYIDTINGPEEILSIKFLRNDEVYDIVEVNNIDHEFIVNNCIITKNCDEFGFVPTHVQNAFWSSILPTLSTGGSCIIASTPNGDSDKFSEIWRAAELGNSLSGTEKSSLQFFPTWIKWDMPPGRDEQFKQEQISLLGSERIWLQEYECVGGESLITVKDINGLVRALRIDTCYETINSYKLIDNYKILTPDGWSNFSGIKKTTKEFYFNIVLDDGKFLSCTPDHLIKVGDSFIEAKNLKENQLINTSDGPKKIIKINQCFDKKEFYDCLEVELNNEYYTNEIVSHNCQFLGGTDTLLDNRILIEREKELLEHGPPELFTIKDIPFFKKIIPGSTYIMAVDPASGGGGDYTAIEVLEFPSLDQVMEFRDNNTRPSEIYVLMKNIIDFFIRNNCEILFSVENNGVGEGIITLYEVDEDFPEEATMIHEDGKDKYGFTTTEPIKLKYSSKLRELIETKNLNIFSIILLKELKNYGKKGRSFAAKSGSTDDCISAYLIAIRILDELSEYDEEAHQKLYALSVKEEDQWTPDDVEIMDDDIDNSMPFIL